MFFYRYVLLGAVDTVACIAQTGHDVAILVQAVVLCAQIDVHIGVCLVQSLDALRCAQQTDELDALCAVLLDLGDGVDGAAAGSQHGIQHQNVTLGDILRQLAREKLCSAYQLATRWIEARTEEELSRYRTVYALAMNICEEAFSRKVITPGVTTTTEVEEWIAQEINRLGLTFWFSPHVDIQRKGMPGVGSCGDIIQHGDLLHYDVGITYFGLCSDSQRLGYVLREDETEVPDYLRKGLEVTNRFQDIVAQEHIAGRTGNEILKSSLERAKQEGIRAMLYCHPIGFYGHSAGTVVGLWDKQEGTGAYGDFPLHYDTCYALELNTESTVAEWDNQLVRFCAEETVAFTEDGKLCYLYPGREKIFAI